MSGTGYQLTPMGDRWSRLLADVTTFLTSIDQKTKMEQPRVNLAALTIFNDPENRREVDELAARSKLLLEKRDRLEAALMTARARFTLECTLKVKQEMATLIGEPRLHLEAVAFGFDYAYKVLASSKKLLLPQEYQNTVAELEAEVDAIVAERIQKGHTVPPGVHVLLHHKYKVVCNMHNDFVKPYLEGRKAMVNAHAGWELIGPTTSDPVSENILKATVVTFYAGCLKADEAFATKWAADLLTFLLFGKRGSLEENAYLDKVLKAITKAAKANHSA